ncbi:MAG: hypothetical protein M5U28_22465 [Sandaracinaceae bacterium]|nr:hypothetical protein [Sandaracinaceae bacterium]
MTTPGTVAGLGTTADLGSYMDSICAVSDTGVVHCWGENNFGELGDGTTMNRASPVAVIGL